jgi:hypothetical protein
VQSAGENHIYKFSEGASFRFNQVSLVSLASSQYYP